MLPALHKTIGYGLMICLLWLTAGCAATEGSASPMPRSPEFLEGQIIDTANGQSISFEQLISHLLQQDVVYLGEEHHNRFHIDSALSVLSGLLAAGRRPVLAMEMFGWDAQPLLDRYVGGGDLSRQDFLSQVGWAQNWGGAFETYEPLVAFAKKEHLRLSALNPPKPLVRLVARKGLDHARQEEDWNRWKMQDETIVDDPLYRQRILEQLRACHGGGSDDTYQTMYEASMVRDEGMARTVVALVESLREGSDALAGPVVSYTGGGHVQYNLPVANRVARRLSGNIRHSSVYMTSFAQGQHEDVREMLAGKIADYIWLTPVSGEGMPRRCR
jgi:uncharacterized iron-regulated protein